MVGDRSFDMVAARAHGLRAVGVAWGIGSREELEAAGRRRHRRHAGRAGRRGRLTVSSASQARISASCSPSARRAAPDRRAGVRRAASPSARSARRRPRRPGRGRAPRRTRTPAPTSLIGPAGTPAALSRATHSAAGARGERGLELGGQRVAVLEPRARCRRSARRRRAPGRPIAAHSRAKSASLPHAPARSRRRRRANVSYGAIDGWRLPRRPGTTPALRKRRALVEQRRERAVHAARPRRAGPRPSCSRARSAARMPIVA